MATSINDAGTWRTLQGVYVNDAGTWREIQEVYVNDAGTWRSVHVNDVITIADYAINGVFPSGSATVAYTLGNDGIIYKADEFGTEAVGQWITPQTNMANYECFASLNSGDSPTGTLSAWQSLSSTRAWSLTRSALAIASCELAIQIRRASDAVVLDTAVIQLSITRE